MAPSRCAVYLHLQLLDLVHNAARDTVAKATFPLLGPNEKTARGGPVSYTTYRYRQPTHYEVRSHTQISR